MSDLGSATLDAPPGEGAKQSRDAAIYQRIYTAIVERHVAPGTKLPEDTLAEAFDVSRTLVRKALARLAHEGLLTIAPNRGARVARPTVSEAREVFTARQLLECAAMPVVVEALRARDLQSLRRRVAREREAERSQDARLSIRLSGDFHVALVAVTGNRPLVQFLRQLVARSSLIVAVYGRSGGQARSCRDHGELLELLAARDAEASRDWMAEHLRAVEETLGFDEAVSHSPDLKQLFAAIEPRGAL